MTTVAYDSDPRDMSLLARIDRLRSTARRFPLSLIELGMRLAVGATFFKSGMLKLQSFDTAIALFRDEYRLPLLPPELAAYMGTAVELSAPVLLPKRSVSMPVCCKRSWRVFLTRGPVRRSSVPSLSSSLPEPAAPFMSVMAL